MKVLLFDTTTAFLTPGGKTTHAIKLQQEISKLGVSIDFARWWDKSQEDVDLIHFLGYNPSMVLAAKARNIKMFYSMIFDHQSSQPEWRKKCGILKARWKKMVNCDDNMKVVQLFDRIQFMHAYDKENAMRYYPDYIDESKTILIPHAYDPADMNISSHLDISEMKFPTKYLISCANISPRKQTVKLARLAKEAGVPIVFMGGRNKDDEYYKSFAKEVDNKYVFDPGYVSKEWKDCIELNASGYVLLSKGESGCIAVYEAAAYSMPLLLSNLPWAWGYDSPTDISFCDEDKHDKALLQLKEFYIKAAKMDHYPFKIHTWGEVAEMYVRQYTELIRK